MTRENIINKIEELADMFPEQRIGQIIHNYIIHSDLMQKDFFYIEDYELLSILEKQIKIIQDTREGRKLKELLKDAKIRQYVIDCLEEEGYM